jgi:hypothetical protein
VDYSQDAEAALLSPQEAFAKALLMRLEVTDTFPA